MLGGGLKRIKYGSNTILLSIRLYHIERALKKICETRLLVMFFCDLLGS